MAFITAAIIGAGASLAGGLLSSRGASRAAQTQANAATEAAKIQAASADKALALQERMYNEQIARNQPYVGAGTLAQNRLMSMLGLQADPRYTGSAPQNTMLPQTAAQQAHQQQWQAGQMGQQQAGTIEGNDPYFNQYGKPYEAAPDLMVGNYQDPGDFSMEKFQQDPGYAFRMSEGLKALDRTAAARGGLISGGALKAASRYGQDMASQEYQNAFNRYNQNRGFNSTLFNQNRAYQTGQYNQNRNFNTDLYKMNRSDALGSLGSLMSSGQNAANQMGAAGQNYAGNASSTFQQAGNAAAAGINAAGQSNAAGQMGSANSIGNALNSAASSYNQANLLNALRGSTPATNWGDTYLYGRE